MRKKNIFYQEKHPQTEDRIPVTRSALLKLAKMIYIMDELEFRTLMGASVQEPNDSGERTCVDFIAARNQKVTCANCDLDFNDSIDSVDELQSRGLDYIGVAHSHGGMSVFHSPMDDTALESIIIDQCWPNNKQRYRKQIGSKIVDTVFSRIYSIVVNKKRQLFAEIFYKELLVGLPPEEQPSNENAIAKVIEVPESEFYDLTFSEPELIKELVSKVHFPSEYSIPRSFRKYAKEYKKLKSDKRVEALVEKIADYSATNSKNSLLLQEAISRIEENNTERLKITSNRYKERLFDLLAFFVNSESCPPWFMEFSNQAQRMPLGELIEKFRQDFEKLYFVEPEQICLDFIVKVEEPEQIPVSVTQQVQTEPTKDSEAMLTEKLIENIRKIEKIYALNHSDSSVQTELNLGCGYAKMSLLCSLPECSFEQFDKSFKEDIKTVLSSKEKDLFSVYEKLKDVKFNEYLESLGFIAEEELEIKPMHPKKILQSAKEVINKERKNIYDLSVNIMIFRENMPFNWTVKYIEDIGKQVKELHRTAKSISKYVPVVPGLEKAIDILNEEKQELHKRAIKYINTVQSMIVQLEKNYETFGEKNEESQKLLAKLSTYMEKLSALPSEPFYRYHKQKCRKLLEVAKNGKQS